MATGAHAHGVVVVLLEVGAVSVGHGAWGVVHGACEEAGKGEANVILHKVDVVGSPFGVFQSKDAFVGEDVGIGAREACGFMDAVIGEDQVVFGGNGGGLIELVGDGGIVAIVEVNLKARNAHGGVVVEDDLLAVDELWP